MCRYRPRCRRTTSRKASLTQTLNAPAGYTYSFSLFVQATQATAISLQIGTQSRIWTAGAVWSRLAFTAAGDPNANAIAFALQIPAGAAVNIFGPQVEAQAAASVYKTGSTGGVYATARFRDDVFQYTSTDVNRHSTTVSIYYAEHL